jgi:hypothetical protein
VPAAKLVGTFNVRVVPGNTFPPDDAKVERERLEITPLGSPDTLYVPLTVPLPPRNDVMLYVGELVAP